MLLNPFKYHSPTTIAETVKLAKELNNVKIQAGGTFIINRLKYLKRKGLKTPDNLISLKKISKLKEISSDKGILKINSMATMSDIINSNVSNKSYFNIIKKTARGIATTSIRNMATIGGNLTCRYTWTEFPTVMIALDADMHFSLSDNKENIISVEDFFKNNAKSKDILYGITIKENKNAVVSYQRAKKTIATDIPLLAICIKSEIKNKSFSNTKVVVNMGNAFPKRDLVLEEFLNNSKLSNNLPQKSLENLDNTIYSNPYDEYKEHMFHISIKNAILELIGNK